MKKLLFLGAIIALFSLIAKKAKGDREAWQGLTEDEVRDKIDQRVPSAVPGDKRQAIADKVVTKMRDHGALADEHDIDADGPIDLTNAATDAAASEKADTSA